MAQTFVLKLNQSSTLSPAKASKTDKQKTPFIMIQIIIALLITLGRLTSAEQWEQLSPQQQNELIIDTDISMG